MGGGRLHYLRVWHWSTAVGAVLLLGVHVSQSTEKTCKMLQERHEDGQSVEKLPRGVCESRLISFISWRLRSTLSCCQWMCWRTATVWCGHRDSGRLSGKWDGVAGICLWCAFPQVYINLPHHGPFTGWFDSQVFLAVKISFCMQFAFSYQFIPGPPYTFGGVIYIKQPLFP